MREIVKRETIETSIARHGSAGLCGGRCTLCGASQRRLGWPDSGRRKVACGATRTFYSRRSERSGGPVVPQRARPKGRADEMVLNDPS